MLERMHMVLPWLKIMPETLLELGLKILSVWRRIESKGVLECLSWCYGWDSQLSNARLLYI